MINDLHPFSQPWLYGFKWHNFSLYIILKSEMSFFEYLISAYCIYFYVGVDEFYLLKEILLLLKNGAHQFYIQQQQINILFLPQTSLE